MSRRANPARHFALRRSTLLALCAMAVLGAAAMALALRSTGPLPAATLPAATPLAATMAAAPATAAASPAAAEQPFYSPEPPQVEYPTWPYDGRFTFARIKFRPIYWDFSRAYTWGLDLKWNHDYPEAEINFMKILEDLTELDPMMEGGNLIELTDPRLFEHPWAYMCEPGFWAPTDEEVGNLREYLLKGGFLVIDDFFDGPLRTPQWDNFERQLERLFPEGVLYKIDESHPALRVFFELDDVDFFDPELSQFSPVIYGLFENNDPEGRLMMVVNYNMDIGDYWEWSDRSFYPVHLTEKGFKLGLNYVMYGFMR